MATAVAAVGSAINATLLADATLGGILAGDKVHNVVAPQGAQYPYITVGESIEQPWESFQRDGNEGIESIHVWSKVLGKSQVMAIYGHLNRLLHKTTLAVSGSVFVSGRLSLTALLLDPDRVTVHLAARYEWRTRAS